MGLAVLIYIASCFILCILLKGTTQTFIIIGLVGPLIAFLALLGYSLSTIQ